MRGVVLTYTKSLPGLVDSLLLNQLGALKVVTAWGVSGGWTDANRRLAARVSCLIVRTKTGDGKRLDPNAAIAELQPWYVVRPDLLVEIGNEPNAPGAGMATDKEIWEYRYNLVETIRRIRVEMPRARIISPAMVADASMTRWLAILGDTTPLVDYVGVHAYEWYSFTGETASTGQLKLALDQVGQMCKMYAHKPIWLTELGINDMGTPMVTKLRRYRELENTLPGNIAGAVYYHICDDPIDHDQRAYAFTAPVVAHLK